MSVELSDAEVCEPYKLTVGGSVRIGDQEFVVLSFSSRNFLYNQVLSLTFFLFLYYS